MMASGTAVGLENTDVRGIFQGVSEYGRVMGLDSESMKGSMRAIEQMLNKGQVMS
jgi:phage tail tape-measure protein